MCGVIVESTELLQAIRQIVSEELEVKLEPINTRLDGIDARLDGIDTRLDNIEEDIEIIKEDCAITRSATNALLEWAEDPTIHQIPLFKQAQ